MSSPVPIPFVSDRFHEAAPHYLGGRPAYSPALIRRVAQMRRLDGTQRLLDLGCGPGQLSLAFASWVAQAVALDPEAAMLEVAAQLGAAIAPNIEYRQGSSYDLSADADAGFGVFDIVTIGRAFHWMERADTLVRLDKMVTARGAVVLFNTTLLDDSAQPWAAQYRELIGSYSKGAPAHVQRESPGWESHDDVLARSVFSELERVSVIERRRVSAAQLKERPLSMSSLSRERIGGKLDALLASIDALVAAHSRDGWFVERIESTALIATRKNPR